MSKEGDFLDFHPPFTFGKGFSNIVFRTSKDLNSARKTQVGLKPYDKKRTEETILRIEIQTWTDSGFRDTLLSANSSQSSNLLHRHRLIDHTHSDMKYSNPISGSTVHSSSLPFLPACFHHNLSHSLAFLLSMAKGYVHLRIPLVVHNSRDCP